MAMQPDGTPRYAVIIPHYNDTVRLARCLATLMQNDTDDTEIVVVDNQSDTPLDTLAAQYPSVRFVTEPSKGAAAARNRGVLETSAPCLFFLDADCVPTQGWLSAAKAAITEDVVIGGRIDVFDEGTGPRTGAQAFETVFAFDQRLYVEEHGFSVTANLLTTRAVFNDVGPLIVGVSEDVDWCRRATAKGYRLIYDDSVAVQHPTRADWGALRKKWRRMTDEAFELKSAQPFGRLKWGLRALAMPLSVIAHAPRVITSQKLRSGRERLQALMTLAQIRMTRLVWMLSQSIRP
jgi:GT2 family glycosyltransferase